MNLFYKKLAAAFMLLNLIFVNCLQSLHNHELRPENVSAISKHRDPGSEKKSFQITYRCFFCETQFVKEFDHDYYFFKLSPLTPVYKKKGYLSYQDPIFQTVVFFENRGPPAVLFS
jgi:hypothetical protein